MKTSFGAPAVAAVVLVAAGALAQQPRGADSSQKAPEISRELSQLQRELQQAGSGPDYQRLRTQSLSVRDKAISLNLRDLAFVAEATAFIASNRQRKHTQNQIEALPLILQALADSRTALSDFPFAADRATADSFVINLALLLEDASTFPFTLLNARPRSNDLLKELASAVEQSIPIDFHLGPRSRDPNESLRQSVQVSEYLATLSFRYGNAAVAVKRLTAAAEVARGIGDADLWAAMLSTLYDGEKAAGALSTRTKDLRAQARRAATALRASYASRAGRIWATYRSDALYGKMLRDQLGEAGESPGAIFAAVEALKARTLLDELKLPRATIVSSKRASDTEQRAIGFDKLPDVMFQGNEMLRSESRLVTQLTAFELPGRDSGDRQEALKELEALYSAAGAGFMSVAAPASLGEIQQALGPREAILEYTIPYNEADPAPGIWMLLIAHDRFVPARAPMEKVKVENCMLRNRIIVAGTPLDGSPLGCTVINLRIGIQRGDDDYAKQSLAALYRLLIEPLLAKGVRIEDFDRLIVVPHGPLHYVPFAALRDETGNYLVSKTAVTVAPSASVWRLLAARQGEARRLMSFSNPTLQHGAEEVGKVMASARAAGLTASPLSEAAKSRFLEAMTPANILHLATHGAAPDEDADDNQPLFLDGDGKTPVRASEIRSLQLTANRLTVLSVCDAGLYRTGPGNEPYGLMPAFLQAGSQNVLATLWPLDDLFGREFMTEFYSHLWSDGPAGAMRQTAIHFIDNRQPIRNWAAFVLMGPGRAFETSESR